MWHSNSLTKGVRTSDVRTPTSDVHTPDSRFYIM